MPQYDVIYPYDAASNHLERALATAVNFDTLVLGAAATYGYNRYLAPHFNLPEIPGFNDLAGLVQVAVENFRQGRGRIQKRDVDQDKVLSIHTRSDMELNPT